jgi:hypothetical protein
LEKKLIVEKIMVENKTEEERIRTEETMLKVR